MLPQNNKCSNKEIVVLAKFSLYAWYTSFQWWHCDIESRNSEFGFSGFFLVRALAFKKVITTNVMDKLEGVRFYSSSATTDNEVLSTPFYYSNLKLYPVIGS